MSGSTIWEITVPDITVEEVLTIQGYRLEERKPGEAVLTKTKESIEKAVRLAKPKVIWQLLPLETCLGEGVCLAEAITFSSKTLARVTNKSTHLHLYAMTLGRELEEQIDVYNTEGRIMEAYGMDAVGSVLLAKSAQNAVSEFEKHYQAQGKHLTFPLGPGHSYWPGLEDVAQIIDVLHAQDIGIQVTEMNLMLPRKSLAFVIGVGDEVADLAGKTHCDFCHIKSTCSMRTHGEAC